MGSESIPFERTHELKVWPEYFEAIASGRKTFELRWDDRGGFLAGDTLLLREWKPEHERYTGRQLTRKVTYAMTGSAAEGFGLKPGYALLALSSQGGDHG